MLDLRGGPLHVSKHLDHHGCDLRLLIGGDREAVLLWLRPEQLESLLSQLGYRVHRRERHRED